MNTCKYIVNQITRRIYWTAYCIVLFFSIQHFGKLRVNLNGLVVKVLDSESGNTMRGFNWEHSNSYIMHKLTDLWRFFQIQYFSKFYSGLSCKYWGMHPNKIFQWRKGIVSCPIKYGKKIFMADGGQIILGKFIGGLLYMEG